MTKLSDTQLVILTAACQRDDRSVFPITGKLSGGAVTKVLQSLLARSLISESPADAADEVWRVTDDEVRLTLHATMAAEEALGIADGASHEPGPADPGADAPPKKPPAKAFRGRTRGKSGKGAGEEGPAKDGGAHTPAVRAGTKQSALVEMLRRDGGATIAEMVAATGWQPHTVRGAIAGALKKKLSLKVDSDKVEGRGRVYRIAS